MLSSFSMQRLSYRFTEFTRHHWADAAVRAIWEQRIGKVSACVAELEWRSILEGVRSCALRPVAPDELEGFGSILARYGLIVVPLEKLAVGNAYTSVRRQPLEGEPFDFWCAVGRPLDVQLVESLHSCSDNEALGRLLGYPPCCTAFYDQVRRRDQFMDTTWPMARNTTDKRTITAAHIEIPALSKSNILLKCLGIRVVFHLPCSFDCLPTADLAETLIDFAKAAGFHEEMNWLIEMLSWPVEWSALYGLADISTPLGTTYTATDVTATRYQVSYRGGG
jgi:hypothetical protein